MTTSPLFKRVPDWMGGLTHSDWLFDGSRCTAEQFASLDWSKAWVDLGPSPAGNLGPYWHVPHVDGDTTHRLYPKLLKTKWANLVRQAATQFAEQWAKRLAASPEPPAISDDLIGRLRELSRRQHDDLSIGDEAADMIETLRERVKELERLYRERTELAEAQRRRAEAAEAEFSLEKYGA